MVYLEAFISPELNAISVAPASSVPKKYDKVYIYVGMDTILAAILVSTDKCDFLMLSI